MMKIAVVHNGSSEGVVHRFGQPCPERYSPHTITHVAESLESNGHTTIVLEGDRYLLDRLADFTSSTAADDASPCIVFNMAYGIQGEARYTHVPAMLETGGFPYTGSSPLGHALALDKVIAKMLLAAAGVPTPAFCVLGSEGIQRCNLLFPLVVKPRHESTSLGLRLVHDPAELHEAVKTIAQEYQQEALVEEYIEGRELNVGVLGNDSVELLPPVELDFLGRELRLVTWDDKFHKRADEPRKICPANLDRTLHSQLNEFALKTFQVCQLKDYARVDFRVDEYGHPFVLEVNSMASLGENGSYVLAARAAGYDFSTLVNRIIDIAHDRYVGPFSRQESCRSTPVTQNEETALATIGA